MRSSKLPKVASRRSDTWEMMISEGKWPTAQVSRVILIRNIFQMIENCFAVIQKRETNLGMESAIESGMVY